MNLKTITAAAAAILLAACVSTPPPVVVTPAPAPAPMPEPTPPPADVSLHDRVHAALASSMGTAAADISVRVEGTIVYLSGHVATEADRQRAHDIAHAVSGVTRVDLSGLMVH